VDHRAEVFVDFNELGRDPVHLYASYPGHVRDRRLLSVGEEVLLTDLEGTYATGIVRSFEDYGRGTLVVIGMREHSAFFGPSEPWELAT